jgi:hypothetical protein
MRLGRMDRPAKQTRRTKIKQQASSKVTGPI